jgi:hypothetical protein
LLLAVLLALLLLPAPSAQATVIWNPNLEITGDPTPAEVQDIQEAWTVLTAAFPSAATCMEPVTVHVVDRVEDHYSYPISFSIAAFYRYPPSSTVFIEHGKVRPAVILHEFAHHMDVSCGFGRSDHGDHFLEAEGYETSHEWIHGTSWYRVPAERFAEGVLMYLGVEEIEIVVGDDAIDLIAAWAVTDRDVPTEVAPGLVVV